jgi:hypothetical protein
MTDLKAFIAGFVSALVFHQGTLALLYAEGLTGRAPYVATATWPFHVPAVVSLAFWGGLWALALWRLVGRFKTPRGYWTAWIVLGAVLPSLVAWFIVLPLKGTAVAGGWSVETVAGALLLNGAWGFGVALLLRAAVFSRPRWVRQR